MLCTLLFLCVINLLYGWDGFPSSKIELSSYNNLVLSKKASKAEVDSRPEVKIVIFDKVIGYLNWYHQDFVDAAYKNCNTKCSITNRRDQAPLANVLIFHAPTHGQLHPVFPEV